MGKRFYIALTIFTIYLLTFPVTMGLLWVGIDHLSPTISFIVKIIITINTAILYAVTIREGTSIILDKINKRLPFYYDDGGRSIYFKGQVGDCAVRAIAIALKKDYMDVYNDFKVLIKEKGSQKDEDPGKGVFVETIRTYLSKNGYKYIHRKGSLSKDNPEIIKTGTIIYCLENHLVTLKEGVVCDIFNSSGKNTLIQGYFIKKKR
jgi:hypothetical protein